MSYFPRAARLLVTLSVVGGTLTVPVAAADATEPHPRPAQKPKPSRSKAPLSAGALDRRVAAVTQPALEPVRNSPRRELPRFTSLAASGRRES